ncbi:P antigen family member 3-like [Halichoerus grypus]|nr:P antigen family member 3-like isoform X2 [Halichoerus grypus]XP_035942442.1 P antigen family member 3-like isoform X2 [Halichoerus grypus]XP_035942443.1 P antigen family member 3-like isoform X2 [Halichoerus grypus]XP_035942444.1 P antigen family member 3-like isoform X2 [Halichoerus grypus]XP_035942445.1 P antigen family member 3-like isoform X2 [Halichoerus grypus]XP_035942446.1 P antigen family member 3-like isoform X2 [Halichoerus grypus]XP_035942447.1 P antigen family member 3-like i
MNMNWQVRSTFRPRARRDDEKSSQPVGPVVAQLPPAEQPQGEEPPTERKDIIPDQEKKGASVVQGPAPEPNQKELADEKTGGECGDGPAVKGRGLANLEPLKMPEAGEWKPQI